MGTGEAPAAAAPGNPPALHPAAAAPARLMRQEEEEAPRERRGHPGGRRGRGRPGGWADGEVPPGEGEQRDEGWGWGAASLPLSPRAPGEPALLLSPAARSAPAAGSGGVAAAGSPPLTLSLTPHPLSHTHTLTLTHTPSSSLTHRLATEIDQGGHCAKPRLCEWLHCSRAEFPEPAGTALTRAGLSSGRCPWAPDQGLTTPGRTPTSPPPSGRGGKAPPSDPGLAGGSPVDASHSLFGFLTLECQGLGHLQTYTVALASRGRGQMRNGDKERKRKWTLNAYLIPFPLLVCMNGA